MRLCVCGNVCVCCNMMQIYVPVYLIVWAKTESNAETDNE